MLSLQQMYEKYSADSPELLAELLHTLLELEKARSKMLQEECNKMYLTLQRIHGLSEPD